MSTPAEERAEVARAAEMRRRGTLLRAAREDAGIGLRDFAEQIGLSYTHLINVEKGRRLLTDDTAATAARALETTSAALLADPPDHRAEMFH